MDAITSSLADMSTRMNNIELEMDKAKKICEASLNITLREMNEIDERPNVVEKKIDNSIDFLRHNDEQVFHFFFAEVGKVWTNPGSNEPRHETHTIVTYGPETHFDVKKKKFGRSVWRESNFEVIMFETQTWKQNFLVI